MIAASKWTRFVAISVSVASLEACTKADTTGTAAQMATNPAGICVAKETVNALKSVILSNVSSEPDKATLAYENQLSAGAIATLDIPVLDSFDKDVRKAVCSGRVTFIWPNEIVARLKQISPDVPWGSDTSSIQYTIQPQADGAGFVYSVDGPGSANIIGAVRTMVAALVQSDQSAIDAAQAAKTASAAAAAAARDAAADVVSSNASAEQTSNTPAASGTIRYSCSAASGEAGSSAGGGVMVLSIDESRSCINNRTAYARTANGGLARAMISDADRRASVLSFSPDRQTFLRQDFLLNPDQYAAIRQRGSELITTTCPVTSDATEVADVQSRLSAVHHSISPILNSLAPVKRMMWRCTPA